MLFTGSAMKRKRSRKKEQSQPATRQAVQLDRSAILPTGRKWLFRLLAVFVVPLIVLGGVELCLRLTGFGYDPHFFKREKVGAKDCYVANEEFGFRFFPRGMARFPPPVVMPVIKSPDTFRIFIFGESAALGDPRPNYGAGNYLEVLLSDRYPQAKFEIINTSVTAINSHAILPIARECAGHAGDLWIIYMGNNEMVGPFGAATVFGARAPPLWWVRLQLQLRQLRLSQLLLDLAETIRPANAVLGDQWHGMEMFVQNQIPSGDPSKQRAYENFKRNLDDVLKAGVASGAKIVLSTVAVNLKDCPPFVSDPSLTNNVPYEQFRHEGGTALAQGRIADAVSSFQRATEMCPQSAEARFQLATCLLHLTNAPAARSQFLQAADHDALPFRADSRINDIIRAAARRFAGESVVLCDSAEALSAASPHGISGDELFYEHVHLNPDGNYALALAWAGQIDKLLDSALKRDERPSWASQADCEQRLGLTEWNRVSILDDILRRIQRPPFSGQAGQAERVARLQKQIAESRALLTDQAAGPARDVYDRALRRAPENFRLHANYAEFLEARREWKPASAQRRKVLELVPQSYFPYYTLGVALKETGELAEAHDVLLRADALKPNDGDVLLEMGTVSGRQGQWERARQELEAARRFSPDDPRAALFMGEVLLKLERRNEALASLREAIRLNPNDWQPHYRLAHTLAVQGNSSGAAVEYGEALRLNPGSTRAKLGLAAVLPAIGRRDEALLQLSEVLQLEPTNVTALELERKIRGN